MSVTLHARVPAGPTGESEASRVRLASRATTAPAVLAELANDPAPTVRAAVALNPTFAREANQQLVKDSDERIRCLLATKMARLLPGLSLREQTSAQDHVEEVLRTLANDAAVRVRAAMAEALTHLPDAPRDIILTLARDPVAAVSDPIVSFSPLLTDADLLGLLATPPHGGTAVAVASRAGLSATLSDAIAKHADSAALVALLSNSSATIQEATLDALIGQAREHPEWHEPLVARPALPGHSIRALAMVVAGHLFDALVNRADIAPELALELRNQVTQSLAAPHMTTVEGILDAVRALHSNGELTEDALLEAAERGQASQVRAILAVASGTSLELIDRAVALRSAKALVSLVHRAGFSMQAGLAVQTLLGQLGPSETLAAAEDGSHPLTASEMEWQIELLGEPGR